MKQIICLPGLGADERLFNYIDIPGNKHFIKWVKPSIDDNLSSYLLKIKSQITCETPPVLIGVSLGGIVAMELRELIPVEKTIIISSVKMKSEMPVYFDWIRKIRLDEIIPASIIKKAAPVIKPFITGANDKKIMELFNAMSQSADSDFIKQSIRFVLDWQRKEYDKENLIHIHGTKDVVFPFRNISNCDYKINGGAHDMIMSKSDEINRILSSVIN